MIAYGDRTLQLANSVRPGQTWGDTFLESGAFGESTLDKLTTVMDWWGYRNVDMENQSW
jgi:hypothetical protein